MNERKKKRQNEACTCTSHICNNCYSGGSSVCFSRWNEEKQNKQKNYIVNYGCLFIDCTLWCETQKKMENVCRCWSCVCVWVWTCFGKFVDISYMFWQILMTKQLKINAATCHCFEYHCNWIWHSWVSFFTFLRLHWPLKYLLRTKAFCW